MGSKSEREQILDAFRRWGYLEANLDPLGMHLKPKKCVELVVTGEAADEGRRYYCGAIGAEFMHIGDPKRRQWIQERLEVEPPLPSFRERILERLMKAEIFEQVMQSRYLGTKRFSLEGLAALIPLLDEVLQGAGQHSLDQAVIAMSHRGRLNVLAHIANKSLPDIFAKFEDVDPRSVLGSGDVKYHIGATGEYETRDGKRVRIHVVSNPSHLEAVDPVAVGRVKAKQVRCGENGWAEVLPIVIHGDSAFAGQGIWAETLNLSGIKGFDVGGSVHVIANNLIGFTTEPWESSASRFSSDMAKRLPIPIFHVNAEDPDAVVRVAALAIEYRYTFKCDVVVDLIGYRRHGHSEVDDPTITQPLLYKKIKDHPPVWQLYAEKTGKDATQQAAEVRRYFEDNQKEAAKIDKMPIMAKLPDYWDHYFGGTYKKEYEVSTGLSRDKLTEITQALSSYPKDFHIHPKIKKLLEQRAEMGTGKRLVDYGMGEALAFGSLVAEGTPVRLTGQDTRRGTFNQRHSVLIDIENEHEYEPLNHVASGQALFQAYNSILSEAAVMGFEYGYSRDFPEGLTLWEAQFGDFANGAQIIIDQFISAGEDKWGLLSGLVLLLPHGSEGQGPEHSSARIERFLQLAGRDNIQVTQPSSAAQYFHLLRRQALRAWRKPLIVFTPKSMLRNPNASSSVDAFTASRFLPVVPDPEVQQAERVLFCSGKIGHELKEERKRRKDASTAIVFVDQMYPLPEAELTAEMERYPQADIVWVQEEPANMGPLPYMMPRLRRLARGRQVRSVKRSASASPATGSAKAHELEQKTLLTLAFTVS